MVNAPPIEIGKTEASRQIGAFQKQWGEKHLIFACHAALPLAITPKLLYQIWATFQRDIHNEYLNIPWIAVSDFLLSGLCKEVGNDLYELEKDVRDELLLRLQHDQRFGKQRLKHLCIFLHHYVRDLLRSKDLDERDYAQTQRWAALAYIQPSVVARELAIVLSESYQVDKTDLLRIAEIVKSLSQPLENFPEILAYAQGLSELVRGNLEGAKKHFKNIDKRRGIGKDKIFIPQELTSEVPIRIQKYALKNIYKNKLLLRLLLLFSPFILLISVLSISRIVFQEFRIEDASEDIRTEPLTSSYLEEKSQENFDLTENILEASDDLHDSNLIQKEPEKLEAEVTEDIEKSSDNINLEDSLNAPQDFPDQETPSSDQRSEATKRTSTSSDNGSSPTNPQGTSQGFSETDEDSINGSPGIIRNGSGQPLNPIVINPPVPISEDAPPPVTIELTPQGVVINGGINPWPTDVEEQILVIEELQQQWVREQVFLDSIAPLAEDGAISSMELEEQQFKVRRLEAELVVALQRLSQLAETFIANEALAASPQTASDPDALASLSTNPEVQQAELEAQRATVRKLQAELELEQSDLSRIEDLVAEGALAPIDLSRQQTAVASVEVQLQEAMAVLLQLEEGANSSNEAP